MSKKKSLIEWFQKKQQEKALEYKAERMDIPGDLWVKCYKCSTAIYKRELEKNLKVCPKCGYHFKLTAKERIAQLIDDDTFVEHFGNLKPKDFLNFRDAKSYAQRINDSEAKSGINEAIITGEGKLGGNEVCIGVMDFSYMGGSMGSVVGERIARIIEKALDKKAPVIIVATSGGARMQEGIMSLMQMAKTSAALSRLKENNLPYISILTDPTTGGTSASFAMLGDLNIGEPGALIGFSGQRVIEQTIRQKLPPGFQRSEYLLEHGMLDAVVPRPELKGALAKSLEFFRS